jgi:hypothetical protein
MTAEELPQTRGRQAGSGVKNDPRWRTPAGSRAVRAALLHLQLAVGRHCARLQALLDVEILEARSTTAEICAALRQKLKPSRVEGGMRTENLGHAVMVTAPLENPPR